MNLLQRIRFAARKAAGQLRSAWQRARLALGGWLWAPVLGRLVLWLGLFLALAHVGAGTVGRLIGLAPVAAAAQRLSSASLETREADAVECAASGTLGCTRSVPGPADAGPPADGGPRDAEAPPARLPDGRIVLNVAEEKDLVTLPGIGPVRARAILALRTKLGRFRRTEDLLRVRGIGPKAVARLRPRVVVNPPPAAPTP